MRGGGQQDSSEKSRVVLAILSRFAKRSTRRCLLSTGHVLSAMSNYIWYYMMDSKISKLEFVPHAQAGICYIVRGDRILH